MEIYEKLLQKESLATAPPLKEFVSGEGFHYLGRSYRLKIVDNASDSAPLQLHQGRFCLQRRYQNEGRDLFIQWYRTHLKSLLNELIPALSRRIGTEPPSVHVRELGYRWGSCASEGDLYFNWRVAMLPKPMIEYVVSHELVHLIEHQHTASFWERLQRVMPDYDDRKRWLAEQGQKYTL